MLLSIRPRCFSRALRSVAVVVVTLIITGTCVGQSATVENVHSVNVWSVVRDAIWEKNHATIESHSNSELLSGWFKYSAHLISYRAKYHFYLQGTTLTVTLEQKEQGNNSSYTRQLIPAKGAEQKLATEMADRVRTMLDLPKYNDGSPQWSPLPAPPASTSDSPQPTTFSAAIETRANGAPDRFVARRTTNAHVLVFDNNSGYVCGEGLCAVERDQKVGFVEVSTGKLVIPFVFGRVWYQSSVPVFHAGICLVSSEAGLIYIDKTGKRLFQNLPRLGSAWPFKDGIAMAKAGINDSMLLIDTQGRVLATLDGVQGGPALVGDELPYSEGLLRLYYEPGLSKSKQHSMSNGWGFVNSAGQWVIPHQYSKAQPFHEGLAWVMDRNERKWGPSIRRDKW